MTSVRYESPHRIVCWRHSASNLAIYTMRPSRSHAILALLLCIASGTVAAQRSQPSQKDPTIDPKMVAAGFLDSHPDLLYRSRGLERYGEKNHPEAFKQFKRAAWYSDKPSQAIIGEMLWIGLGADKDRGLAYVWMDLAAERGYRSFSEKRDMYWQQLDEHERARAKQQGPAIRAEYADAVAGERLASVLRRERRQMTGSRLGSSTSPLVVYVPGVGSIDGSQYYNPKYWDPVQYREWQDSIWTEVRIGRVNVGDVEQVRDPGAGTPPPQDAPPPPPEAEQPD